MKKKSKTLIPIKSPKEGSVRKLHYFNRWSYRCLCPLWCYLSTPRHSPQVLFWLSLVPWPVNFELIQQTTNLFESHWSGTTVTDSNNASGHRAGEWQYGDNYGGALQKSIDVFFCWSVTVVIMINTPILRQTWNQGATRLSTPGATVFTATYPLMWVAPVPLCGYCVSSTDYSFLESSVKNDIPRLIVDQSIPLPHSGFCLLHPGCSVAFADTLGRSHSLPQSWTWRKRRRRGHGCRWRCCCRECGSWCHWCCRRWQRKDA